VEVVTITIDDMTAGTGVDIEVVVEGVEEEEIEPLPIDLAPRPRAWIRSMP
jgi:hypothetical protein